MSRVYNFSAGPAVLPEEVLQEAADEMLGDFPHAPEGDMQQTKCLITEAVECQLWR